MTIVIFYDYEVIIEMEAGKIINYYRKKQGLTQSQLASEICTQSEISLIEKGLRYPSVTLVQKLCQKLSISISLFQENRITDIELSLYKLENLVYQRKYLEMRVFFSNESLYKQCIDPYSRQSFLYYEGIYNSLYLNNQSVALDLYQLALNETRYFNINHVKKSSVKNDNYSKNEIIIIAAIGCIYFIQKNYKKAEHFFTIAYANIDNFKHQINTENLTLIYYSSSKNLRYLQQYKKSLEIAHAGIKFINSKISQYRLPELLHEVAENNLLLQNLNIAEKYYIKSLCAALSSENYALLNIMITEYKQHNYLHLLQNQIKLIEQILINNKKF